MSKQQAAARENTNPDLLAILDAIDEISVVAQRNETGSANALASGFVHPELQDKFTKLGDKLAAFAKRKIVSETAERLIELDYKEQRPGRVLVDHYFDNPLPTSYIAFLVTHNAHLRTDAMIAQLAILNFMAGGGIKRPDILTDLFMTKEFYEIKPDSDSGLASGLEKLSSIDAFMGTYGLPYRRGNTFVPTSPNLLSSGTFPTVSGPVPFRLYLRVRLSVSGLMQYKICVETDFEAIGTTILTVIAAVLMALWLKGQILPTIGPVTAPMIA